jgi:gluconate 2-dehydrogenase gamma chain
MKRRSFIAGAAAAATACRRAPNSQWRTLTDSEAQTLAVLCAEIIPADDSPGAQEAGAVNFIDIQLTRHYRAHRVKYSAVLARAQALASEKFGRPPAQLSPDERLRLARELERAEPAFFTMLVAHTMQSFYGSPRHGGNRDAASWRMLGVPPVQVRGRSPA